MGPARMGLDLVDRSCRLAPLTPHTTGVICLMRGRKSTQKQVKNTSCSMLKCKYDLTTSCLCVTDHRSIHRHHKRTPYASNTFPKESYGWSCDDQGLFYYGKPLNPAGNESSSTYWSVYTSDINPFAQTGFNGSCQFPQITRQGLDDSWQHGKDLFGVYHDLLGFLPKNLNGKVSYRVTNNQITSQVAGMLIDGMYTPRKDVSLRIQPTGVDSLEPQYSCPAASSRYSSYGVGSKASNWTAHLTAAKHLFDSLDSISGIASDSTDWHKSFDHYYDNLSARQCHAKPLPCNTNNTKSCVTQEQADTVYRLGQYEYSFIYRDSPQSLQAAVGSYGVWLAELAKNIRDSEAGKRDIRIFPTRSAEGP